MWAIGLLRLLLPKNVHLLFTGSVHPFKLTLKLLLGYSASLAVPPRRRPADISRHRDTLLASRYDGITVLRQIPLFLEGDSPTASIYRMCDFICSDDVNQLMLEKQYFWHNEGWRIKDIPDPDDDNPERRAILAGIVETMVGAFNWRYSLGLKRGHRGKQEVKEEEYDQEECPGWNEFVPPLSYELRFYEKDIFDEVLPAVEGDPFRKRNVIAHTGNFFNI